MTRRQNFGLGLGLGSVLDLEIVTCPVVAQLSLAQLACCQATLLNYYGYWLHGKWQGEGEGREREVRGREREIRGGRGRLGEGKR